MEKYIVLYFKPLDKKRVVKKFEVDSLEVAKKLADNKKKHFYDVLIVKEVNSCEDGKKERVQYELVRFGYYKVYNSINYIIYCCMLVFLIFFFYYLYLNKFFN